MERGDRQTCESLSVKVEEEGKNSTLPTKASAYEQIPQLVNRTRLQETSQANSMVLNVGAFFFDEAS